MHRLETHQHDTVRPIFAALAETQLHVTAVLDGTSPGEVHVDDRGEPQTACLRAENAYYLAGGAGNGAFEAALNRALPRDTYFVLFYDAATWEGALDRVLDGTYAVRAARCYYTLCEPALPGWRDRVPGDYTMRPVDARFLAQDLENFDQVQDWILEGWPSAGAFLARGFGHCLVHDDEIVSWSLADYISGDRCEMGIVTSRDHRRQGLGTLAAAATAETAAARGYATTGWHCWANNVGSIGVARNVGFVQTARYDVFINHWAAENITDMTAEEFRAFALDYEARFRARPPASGFPHIVAAKAWALAGDRAGCFAHLHQAVELGWLRDAGHLRQIWPEFFWNPNLDEMVEWRRLVRSFGSTA